MAPTREQPYYSSATKAKIDEERLGLERFRNSQVRMAGAINSALDFLRTTGIHIENAQVSPEIANEPEALKEALQPYLNLVFTVAEAFEQRIAQNHQHHQQAMESSVKAAAEAPQPEGVQQVEPAPLAPERLMTPVEEPPVPPVQEQAKEKVPAPSDPAESPITTAQRNYLTKLWGMLGTPAEEQIFPATKQEASDLINRLGEEKKQQVPGETRERSRETQPPAREPTQSQLVTIAKIFDQLGIEEKDRKVPFSIEEANKLIKELMQQRSQNKAKSKASPRDQEDYPGRTMRA